MPRRASKVKKSPMTLGDLAKKVGSIKTTNLLYVALLVSVFTSGYLFSRVQTLEKTGGGGNSEALRLAQAALTKIANTKDGETTKIAQQALEQIKLVPVPQVAGTEAESAAAAQPKISLDKVKEAFKKSKIKFGDTNSKVIAIEVADPSCPYCHIAGGHNSELNTQSGDQFKLVSDGGTYVAPVVELKKLLDEGKISFSYIYYPGHANGDMATKAMYCAFDQDKFWEAHDVLMSSAGYKLINDTVKNDPAQSQALVDLIASTSIDTASLKECIDSGKYDKQLKDDQALATELQIQGTPGFYLNETSFPGAYSFTDMESAIKAAGL